MSSAAIAPARWNFTASGNSADRDTTHQLRDQLESLLQDSRFGESAVTFSANESGWQAAANGVSPDPADHTALLNGLRDLLSTTVYETGSSEWVSPFGSHPNFHLSPDPAPASPAAPSADATIGTDAALPEVEHPQGY